jgi:SNF2 family DNA or RNA helicase
MATELNPEAPPPHRYSVILNENDPQHPQPAAISIRLKPHQLAGLQKAKSMEQDEYVYYDVPKPLDYIRFANNVHPEYIDKFKVRTNVGIIGDIVGYGKTLLALSIIAALSLERLHMPTIRSYTYHSQVAYMELVRDTMPQVVPRQLNIINTTLVIVPRGPVFMQWRNAVERHTNLNMLCIENLIQIRRFPESLDGFKRLCEEHDLVLIKNTTMVTLLNYYRHPVGNSIRTIMGFTRIMIDEAHVSMLNIPELQYKFLWLITSSYADLLHNNSTRTIGNSFLQLTQHNNERMHYLLIKGEVNFVKNSFSVPQPIENYYICHMSRELSAIQSLLSPAIQEKINVNDIAGAIKELGGKEETQEDLVAFVLREINKDIRNKEKEIHFFAELDIDPEPKEQRLRVLNNELRRLNTRKESIEERLKEVSSTNCGICYDTLENPIYLSCSHIFCGKCIFNWIKTNSAQGRTASINCPECRSKIESHKIVAIVKDRDATTPYDPNTIPTIFTKEEQLVDIIKKKPNGRFLLFSRVETAFGHLANVMRANGITYCDIKGTTLHMMHILDDFKNGKLKVILLNTAHAGFGIDISCATDVIIYHSMPQEKIQAVGRAQRVGRTSVLTVHNLCYAHEMNAQNRREQRAAAAAPVVAVTDPNQASGSGTRSS